MTKFAYLCALLGIYYGVGCTAVEIQVRTHSFRWCYLKGGKWKSWLQLNRFSHYRTEWTKSDRYL